MGKTYNISTKIITVELSKNDEIVKVEKYIQELGQLDILINNAGYWIPGNFWEREPSSIEDMIRVHVIAPVRFIRAALPNMLKRNKGSIVNVSSIGAYLNVATVENYSGTKAYILTFSEALHVALMGTGLKIQVLVPGLTQTEFHSRLGMEIKGSGAMLPESVVDISLSALSRGKVVCIPGFKNRFLVGLMNLLPRSVYYKIMHNAGEKAKKAWEEISKKQSQ